MMHCCISGLLPSQLPLQGRFPASPALQTIKGPRRATAWAPLGFCASRCAEQTTATPFPPHNSHLAAALKLQESKPKGWATLRSWLPLGLARAGLANAHPCAVGLWRGLAPHLDGHWLHGGVWELLPAWGSIPKLLLPPQILQGMSENGEV